MCRSDSVGKTKAMWQREVKYGMVQAYLVEILHNIQTALKF